MSFFYKIGDTDGNKSIHIQQNTTLDTTTKSIVSEQACGRKRATDHTISKSKGAATQRWTKAWNPGENAQSTSAGPCQYSQKNTGCRLNYKLWHVWRAGRHASGQYNHHPIDTIHVRVVEYKLESKYIISK